MASFSPASRAAGRAHFGFAREETILLQPTRAIARKNIAAGVAIAEALGASYWLTGPVEEDYGDELARILEAARCPVYRVRPRSSQMHLAYAAADAVVFPSRWEGFGLPVIEAAFARRPIAVGTYPVAAELWEAGLRWLPTDDREPLRAWLAAPDPELLARNHAVAARCFSMEAVVEPLATLVESLAEERAHALSGAGL